MTRLDPLNFFSVKVLILDQTDLLKINSLTILKSKLNIMKHEIGSFYVNGNSSEFKNLNIS